MTDRKRGIVFMYIDITDSSAIQLTLDQFGDSTGLYYQFYHCKERRMFFSKNIQSVLTLLSDSTCSFDQWLHAVHPEDTENLRQGMDHLFSHAMPTYSFTYRIYNKANTFTWVNSKGTCTYDKNGTPLYCLGLITFCQDKTNDIFDAGVTTLSKDMEQEIIQAVSLQCKGFFLEFQPQVDSKTLTVVGAEALLRFRCSYGRILPPAAFVSFLEASGLMIPVGNWVLRTALQQCWKWREQNADFRISVNLSFVQLKSPHIQKTVLDILNETGLPGSALDIEVTEGMALQDFSTLNAVFRAWQKSGIKVSLDDFGTGYSNLSWLKHLRIDQIKIDRSFIEGLKQDTSDFRLLSGMIQLAKNNSIQVCCEGVETKEEWEALKLLSPALYQGYLFSGPLLPDVFTEKALKKKYTL
jgi:EAL domain-containing protein (putative c-di-GMP-specific phosphodiesterase class I)